MANFATTIPVAHGLWVAPNQFLGGGINWMPNEKRALQKLVFDLKNPSLILAEALGPRIVRSVASDHVEDANNFLKQEEFNIQLQDGGVENMLYVAAVMKLMGEFLKPGQVGYRLVNVDKKAFRLGKEAGIRHFDYEGLKVVKIPTFGNFSLLVSAPTGVSGWNMIADWVKIQLKMRSVSGNGVISPMAKIGETKVKVDELVGMQGDDWIIQEALMAAKFSLTSKRVKFESAFAFSAKRCLEEVNNLPEEGDYLVDHDLYFALVWDSYLKSEAQVLPLGVGMVPANELSDIDLESDD